MPLASGTRLGPYEVLAQIGAGGMGEVYRARDTKLGRDVALKILPEALTADDDRIARFRREAQVLASLNHPHIAGIHGLEDDGRTTALVLEFVDGPTLADRIAQGALPPDEALAIAKQIADGLAAAHEKGIIHRDLKPANIKIRPDGTVKLLDFGLAKAMDSAGSSPGLSHAPTATPATLTGAGVVLGTAAYMSPEQARGQALDRRTDIWAFGCVLFEMLTGVRAFPGDSPSDVMAAVLRGEPEWSRLPRDAAAFTGVLQWCLPKDLRQRFRDGADVQLLLDDAGRAPAVAPWGSKAPTRTRRTWLPVVIGAAAGFLLAAIVWPVRSRPAAARIERFDLTPSAPGDGLNAEAYGGNIAIAPDGSRIVYTSMGRGTPKLVMRSLDQLDVKPIPGGEGSVSPFFPLSDSPSGLRRSAN